MKSCVPKISLIIPVYNAEKFINKTLDSVLAQTFTDYEVIVVNDGSTDGSLSILESYENKFEKFKLINQSNSGLGVTRNQGIEASCGEYLAFLDSDDFLAPNFLEVLYNSAVKNNADISSCNYYLYFSKSRKKIYMPFTAKTGIYSNKVALKKIILDTTFHFFVWNKLFKRTLFTDNNISFYNMYFEDVAISPQLFYHANKVVFINKPLYYYRCYNNSILSTINSIKINDFITSLGIIRNFLEEKNIYKHYKLAFKIYSNRFKIQIGYYIFVDHINKYNFSKIWLNLKKAYSDINLFKSNAYVPQNNPPILPFYVKSPESKKN